MLIKLWNMIIVALVMIYALQCSILFRLNASPLSLYSFISPLYPSIVFVYLLPSSFYANAGNIHLVDCDCQARAWLKWEMGLSFFSVSETFLAWDGEEYSLRSLDAVRCYIQEWTKCCVSILWLHLGQVNLTNVINHLTCVWCNCQKNEEKERPVQRGTKSKSGQGRNVYIVAKFGWKS